MPLTGFQGRGGFRYYLKDMSRLPVYIERGPASRGGRRGAVSEPAPASFLDPTRNPTFFAFQPLGFASTSRFESRRCREITGRFFAVA